MATTAGKERTIQVRRCRKDGWTPARRATFLAALGQSCNIRAACAVTGLDQAGLYRLRHRDAEFDAICIATLDAGYRRLEEELVARALGTAPSGDNPGGDAVAAASSGTPPVLDTDLALELVRMRNKKGSGRHRRHLLPNDAKARHALEVQVLRKLEAALRKVAK